MKTVIDRTKGTYILVEAVREGNPECQIVILNDGERLVNPEIMDFEEAVSVADEMRLILGLSAEHGIVTRGAILANKKNTYH